MFVVPLHERTLPPFKPSSAFSLGVEEELHLVDPVRYAPFMATDAVVGSGAWRAGRATGEIYDGVIVLATPVCRRAADALGTFEELRREAVRLGAGLLGAGLHPAGSFGDVEHRDGARYALIGETMRGVMRQTAHCGVHVHVGMPDAETVIRACNGMRKWLPLLHALGANSPYWYGRDSGLASARSVICNSFPRAGIPRAFADYDDFAHTVEELRALGECTDHSYLWWDVRPHPRLGTLEIRALDAQSSHEDLAGLVALVHCLAVHEATAPPTHGGSPEALRELSFRACRDGLDARLLLNGDLRSVREVACHAIEIASAYAADLGCWNELMSLHTLLQAGNGATRQRRHEREGGLRLLLRRLADETLEREPILTPTRRFVRQPYAAPADNRRLARTAGASA
jgi:carboxylate-amine ligase